MIQTGRQYGGSRYIHNSRQWWPRLAWSTSKRFVKSRSSLIASHQHCSLGRSRMSNVPVTGRNRHLLVNIPFHPIHPRFAAARGGRWASRSVLSWPSESSSPRAPPPSRLHHPAPSSSCVFSAQQLPQQQPFSAPVLNQSAKMSLANKLGISDVDVKGKRVLIRVDFNVSASLPRHAPPSWFLHVCSPS